jgi:Double-GTPase 2
MMRPIGRACARGLIGAGLVMLAGPIAATGAFAAAPAAAVPVLTGISAVHAPGYDQVTFDFAGRLPGRRRVTYLSDRAYPDVVGGARLLVTFARASGVSAAGATTFGPAQQAFALPGVLQVVTLADGNGEIRLAVALARRLPFRVRALSHPNRVVIDVRTPFRTVPAGVYFANSRRAFGTAATTVVTRPLPRPATPLQALRRLFAGPTESELARGLAFVSSGATGFRMDLVSGGANVYLTGGCRNGGSTVTIASEIQPTLRQFPSVGWVKIYDPAGRTQQPAGATNSIPACLAASAFVTIKSQAQGPVLLALLALVGLGLLIGAIVSAASVFAGLTRRASLITPSGYRDERIKASPVRTGQFEPDLAWPIYPLRQARADLARIEAQRRSLYGRLWHWPGKPLLWILLLPVSAAAVVCLVAAGVTTVLLIGAYALVTWTLAALALGAFAVARGLLRGIESGWHAVMKTEASCPRCYHVTPRPAYRCPGCEELHRDIRPDRLGLTARRCQCGALLPTMVIRAAWRLDARCQRCKAALRRGSGALRDVRIPVFGDTSAGKTRFIYAGLDSLIATAGRTGIRFGFADPQSQQEADAALQILRSGADTVKTSLTLPTALTCKIGRGLRATLVHLFDAAGENYRDAQPQDSLAFLAHAQSLVYVLDPFSIGSVHDRLAGPSAAADRGPAVADDPETAYAEVVSRLRDSGISARQQRLAVVVSKTDLLGRAGLEPPRESAEIADWLSRAGVHNLVLSAPREFAEVRYFCVASLAAGEQDPSRDPGAALRWLLGARGLRLPGDAAAARRPGRPAPADRTSPQNTESAGAHS